MKNSSTRRRAALGVGVVLAAGWAGSVATASVPPLEEAVVLRLATIDAVNGNGQAYGPQAFVDNLGCGLGRPGTSQGHGLRRRRCGGRVTDLVEDDRRR